MHHFCTSFNQVYLLRALTLYRSMKANLTEPFTLWVLCFDELSFQVLSSLNLPDLRPVSEGEFLSHDQALASVKPNRSMVEYFFSTSAAWPLYLLDQNAVIDRITYLDADLFFFADAKFAFDEMGSASVYIVPHRFPPRWKHMEKHGIYNVGWLSFRNDINGRESLQWWRERCIEWCYDRVEDGKFADQKYLDDWTTRFGSVISSHHKGVNLAPWNWMNYRIEVRAGHIFVDDDPLVFYHFQGVKLLNRWVYDSGAGVYGTMPVSIRRLLYDPYASCLRETLDWARQHELDVPAGFSGLVSRNYGWERLIKGFLRRQVVVSTKPF